VNNRNLKTFKVDLATTERLAAKLIRRTGVAPVSNLKNENGDRQDACPTLNPHPQPSPPSRFLPRPAADFRGAISHNRQAARIPIA
jgi:hypothetical protein